MFPTIHFTILTVAIANCVATNDFASFEGQPLPPPRVSPLVTKHILLRSTSSDEGSIFEPARLWLAWKTAFEKSYESGKHEIRRFEKFVDNYKRVQMHNERFRRGLETFDIELNRFADMPRLEIAKKLNGFRPELKIKSLLKSAKNLFYPDSNFEKPHHVDWRPEAVTPVKDQGNCGCCWAFSTTGALEGQYYFKSGRLASLSEQNLVDCSFPYGNQGCNGGLMDFAFDYVEKNGIDLERNYPFKGTDDGKCRFSKFDEINGRVLGYTDLPIGDEQALAEAVARYGPVSVAIDASHRSLLMYTEGVYYEPMCGNSTLNLDHAVLVVGYGTDAVTGMDYWLVKNSWSANWGEEGYVRMARNRDNHCGIALMPSFPKLHVKSLREQIRDEIRHDMPHFLKSFF